MHPAEYYALTAGVKIEKPKIYLKYQPIPYDKYILVNPKDYKYKYWQEVIDLIHEQVKNNGYHIIQVVENGHPTLKNVNHFLDKNNFNINSYICKQSSLYLGEQSMMMHLCGIFEKKIISVDLEESHNIRPYWSNAENFEFFDIERNPYPETISRKVLNFLGLKDNCKIKTHFIGKDFSFKKVEIIPSNSFNINPINKIGNHIVRMDINFNEAFLNEFLSIKSCMIYTKKPIESNLLRRNRRNILNIIYLLDENYDILFIKNMKELGIKYTLMSSSSPAIIKKLKYQLMDYGLIMEKCEGKRIENLNQKKNLYFKSGRILYDGTAFYSSEYHYSNKMPQSNLEKVEDNPNFWQFSEDFYVFSID